MPVRDKILLTAIFLFIISLSLPQIDAVRLILTVFLAFTAFFYTPFSEKLRLFKERRYLAWMLLFFVLVFASVLLSSNQRSGFRYLDTRLPLIYFPLSIGLVQLKKELRITALSGIAIIITVMAMACLVYGIYRSSTFHDTAYLYNDALTEPITGQQSIYISLLVNFAIYIFTWLLLYIPGIRFKGWIVLAILFLFIVHFLLASRIMMLVLYSFTLAFAFYYMFSRKKYLEGATLLLGLVIGVFLIFKFFPKTLNRFKELTYTQFNYQKDGQESHFNMAIDSTQWNGANTRLAIWGLGWNIFRQHPVFGVHLGDKKDELMKAYREKDFAFAIRTQKNLHSNYLDLLVSMGIIGLAVFLIAWIILPLAVAWRYRDGLTAVMILTFVIAMITENYLDRNLGGLLIGFFIPFMLSNKSSKS